MDIAKVVNAAIDRQPVIDMHTHLYPPSFGTPMAGPKGKADADGLLLWGVDELLTYHYLVAEVFRIVPASVLPYEQFWKMSKRQLSSSGRCPSGSRPITSGSTCSSSARRSARPAGAC